MRAPVQLGVVAHFDGAAGLGTVRGDDGRDYGFHCTQIADGSRAIDEGAAVAFEVVAGHLGRWEAAAVRPC
jgi:cold shock CspA family protein